MTKMLISYYRSNIEEFFSLGQQYLDRQKQYSRDQYDIRNGAAGVELAKQEATQSFEGLWDSLQFESTEFFESSLLEAEKLAGWKAA